MDANWTMYALFAPLMILPPVTLGVVLVARSKSKAFAAEIKEHLAAVRNEAAAAALSRAHGPLEGTIAEGNEDIINQDDDDQDLQKLDTVQRYEDLPICVRDFLDHSVRDDREIAMIKLTQIMKIRSSRNGTWKECTSAIQHASPLVPAFLFTGSAAMAPGIFAKGFETLSEGCAKMQWRLYGAFTVADSTTASLSSTSSAAENERELLLNKAGRARWLAEASCYPQALKPSQFLYWEGVKDDANKARAILDDGKYRVSCLFTFSRGKIVALETPDYARVGNDGKLHSVGMKGTCKGHMLFGLSPVGALPNRRGSATTGGVVVPTDLVASFVEQDGTEWQFLKTVIASVRAE